MPPSRTSFASRRLWNPSAPDIASCTLVPVSRPPFRFAVLAGTIGSRSAWIDLAIRAESLGYTSLLVSDHFGRGRGPFSTLSAAATATGLTVGTLVLANDFRHPFVVADEAAGLAVLSEGRFELGIGTGWLRDDYRVAGIPLDPPRRRVDRLEEALIVIRGLWAEGPFRFEGEHYRADVAGSVLPDGLAPPRLLVAGSGRRLLGLAAREADIVSITATAGEDSRDGFWRAMADAGARIAERVAWVRAAAGRRSVELNVLLHEVAVTEDRAATAAAVAAEAGVEADRVLSSPHVLIGTESEIAATLIDRRERLGISYIAVPEQWIHDLAPVVARLAG